MEVIIGDYVYTTKVQLIEFKSKLNHEFEYVRDNFDYILIKKGDATIKFTQDGLIYIKKKINNLSEIDSLQSWLNTHIISKIPVLDKEDPFYKNILHANRNKRTIVITNPNLDIQKIFKKLDRNHDYTFKTKDLTKNYGDGLIVFNNIKLNEKELEHLSEYQLILAAYQNLVRSFVMLKRQKSYGKVRHKVEIEIYQQQRHLHL